LKNRWPKIESILQAFKLSYTVKFTNHPAHATYLAQTAINNGYKHLLGIGGDGTNHEIINGIFLQNTIPHSDIYYSLLPIGTGNDWARTYKIPKNPKKRIERLMEGNTTIQDIGWVTYQNGKETHKRFFANVAGMAYDAFIAKAMLEDQSQLKSPMQYLWLVARELGRFEPTEATITFNNSSVTDAFYTINIGICQYSGGGMQLVPHARPNDGCLALTYVRKMPKWEVLIQTPRFYNGKILNHPKVEGFQTTSLTVLNHNNKPTLLEADGEFLGSTPATFGILPAALKIVL